MVAIASLSSPFVHYNETPALLLLLEIENTSVLVSPVSFFPPRKDLLDCVGLEQQIPRTGCSLSYSSVILPKLFDPSVWGLSLMLLTTGTEVSFSFCLVSIERERETEI